MMLSIDPPAMYGSTIHSICLCTKDTCRSNTLGWCNRRIVCASLTMSSCRGMQTVARVRHM
jgi:hypothetical protein